jgi:alpha-L-fucosidase
VIGDDEISWSREPLGKHYKAEVYDKFYQQLNPTKFNAGDLVAAAKGAGMRYLVFTAKHHDGFCMWDTKTTDYKVTKAPIGRDLLKELADACHEAGLALGIYYSPSDLYHPDGQGNPPSPEFKKDETRYAAYMKEQLRELLTNYGKVGMIWFDAGYGSFPGWDADEFFQEIHRLQPGIIINNRCGLPGDFYTPEQRVGSFDMERHWESCMTMYRDGYWSWRSPTNGQDAVKPASQCLNFLINAAGGDGNMVLNVSPGPEGTLADAQLQVLKEMGTWMLKYGKSIYGTQGGPFKPGSGIASTRRGKSIYLHILKWKGNVLHLPPINKRIVASRLLTGGTAAVAQTTDGIEVSVPASNRDAMDTLLRLDLDGDSSDIAAVAVTFPSLTTGKKATTSSVIGQANESWGGSKAVDGDPATRWATDSSTIDAWLEVDLGQPEAFNAVRIEEAYAGRTRKFAVEYKDGQEWKAIFTSNAMGEDFRSDFPPVRARFVRLHILDSSGGPTITEFNLYAKNMAK